ncbi:ABC transporter [Lasiodiplodia theobromae]|uniref:ABC transporter n=1 Tax=Lasiodiplodia theobromae TaxID=45133 RepID=UPI0015C3DDF2|nr:ABC transporter [Lasiodiplodia theobromae]KAF4544031.1 ABC transporter [Lasiodiplodia theobromae]
MKGEDEKAMDSSASNDIQKQIDEQVSLFLEGTPEPHSQGSLDVRFRNLNVIGAGLGAQKTPTVTNTALHLLQTFNPARWLSPPPVATRKLLHSFTGTVRGGEILLVLGKPGSGCTTFLKTLANMRQEYHAIEGEVVIGSDDAVRMKTDFPGEFAFSSEDDIHFSSLSVATTLQFSVNARTSQALPSRSQAVKKTLDSLLDLFGLSHVQNISVGDDYKRGVSGGQRHRVTVAEAVSTRSGVMCLDNPTRGLDSSTALKLVQIMRSYTNQRGAATIMSIYQASDAMAQLFDKVLIINAGREIYFGPLEESKQYFEDLGFYYDPRMSLTDFLTTMSGDHRSRIVRQGFSGPPPPVTPEDFEAAFKRSKYWSALIDETSMTPDAPKRNGKIGYALPFWKQVYQCMIRQHRVQLTDRGPWVAEAAGLLAQALMLGTLYWDQQAVTRGLYTRAAALFFNVLVMVLQAFAEFGNTFAQRPILLRHEGMMLYRPAAYALGQILADMPWKAAIVLYNLPTYFLANFQRSVGKFFTWFFVLYCAIMSLGVMFRAIAVFTVSPTRAILPVGLLVNVLIVYTGFYVTPPGMKVWLGWIRYLNPIYYSFEGVMVNEIVGSHYRCSQPDTIPVGRSYNNSRYQTCAVQGFESGASFLEGDAYLDAFYDFHGQHLWRNVGIVLGFFLMFSVAVMIGMERFKMPAGKLATVFFSTGIPTLRHTSDVESQQSGSSDGEKEDDGQSSSAQDTSTYHHVEIVKTQQTFSWKDLCIDVKTADGTKRLLDNVSGYLKPGSMTALMGMSGAGKTTLLNALSHRANIGTLTGSMFLSTTTPLPRSFKRRTGFVHQQDVHLSSSTVREALQLVAYLRQPRSTPRAAKDAYVERVLDLLEMRDVADALIGEAGAGLSLERRKRVSIAVELAAKPDVLLFCDEPTSGLDGDAALEVVRLLRKLADAGLTVLCTIHQPAARLMRAFDELLLLVPGGKTAYCGPLGEDCGVVLEYFGRHTRKCEAWENPADYFLAESVNPDVDWFRLWQESPEHEQLWRKLEGVGDSEEPSSLTSNNNNSIDDDDPERYAATTWEQLRVVTHRAFTDYWRDPDYVLGKFHLNIGMGLINSLTYLQLRSSLTDMRSAMFSIFVSIITGPVIALAVEPRFTRLRDHFLARERDSNTYRWPVFVAAAIAVELPWALAGGCVYWCLWHYAVGFPYDAGRAAYAFLMYELYTVFVTGVAQMTAACFPTAQGAQMATGFVFLIVNTFNGPLSPPPLTPRGWRWIYTVSPLYYFVEAMAANAVHGRSVECAPGETSVFFTPPGGPSGCRDYVADYFAAENSTGYLLDSSAEGRCEYCPFLDGDQYIRQYGFAYSNRADNVGIFIGFILFNFSVVFFVTWLFFIRKRKT